MMCMGKGSPGPRVTATLSTRFKYVIGIGVGAGAYVLAKFAVSFPRTVPPDPPPGLAFLGQLFSHGNLPALSPFSFSSPRFLFT